ncbi:DUF3168 domain-containing protein [Salibacterium lacus]|uniref:DUF3168 domain-containing protein n=1 Tax=Salibacterium lacus TaxID=1898109 RepID=A0ABW5SX32_9BACI
MKTALWEVQTAFYSALTAHQPLMDKVVGVYDTAPESPEYPYVTIGEPTVSPFDNKVTNGENIVWVLHCWSQYNGKKEAMEILNLMNEAFTEQPLQIGGGFFVQDFKRDSGNALRVITDVDGQTRHGILRVRLYVTQ